MKIADRYEPPGATSAGGMGEIIECIDLHLQRRVIIKRLQADIEARRLLDEQRALAKVRSKHVVQLYDIVELTDRRKTEKAIVLEFIEGNNLGINSFKPIEIISKFSGKLLAALKTFMLLESFTVILNLTTSE